MAKTRYFFFSYNWSGDGYNGFGNTTFTANGMPKKSNITEKCEGYVKEKLPNIKDLTIVIISWQELRKLDYDAFLSD